MAINGASDTTVPKDDLEIVAINDLGSPATCTHLTRYDTVHGKFTRKIDLDGGVMSAP